jgi:probable rRNA maturation factor
MGTVINATRAARTRPGKGRRRAKLTLTVQYATRARGLPSERQFGRWIRAALAGDARITVRLIGVQEGRALNLAYRRRDYATNVLTFVLDDGPPYDGDLALCAPLISREARAQGKDVMAHYAHLAVHGALHLQGYDHERKADAARMEMLETRILSRLGYPDPYAPPPAHGRQSQ